MDPNETLRVIREYVVKLQGNDTVTPAQHAAWAMQLAEHVEALDVWLSNHGYLPVAWTQTHDGNGIPYIRV